MKKSYLVIILLFSILCGCQTEKKISEKQEYLRWVGDIEQNDQIDDLSFEVCNGDDKILQYFNLGEGPVYNGEKSKVLNSILPETGVDNAINTGRHFDSAVTSKLNVRAFNNFQNV